MPFFVSLCLVVLSKTIQVFINLESVPIDRSDSFSCSAGKCESNLNKVHFIKAETVIRTIQNVSCFQFRMPNRFKWGFAKYTMAIHAIFKEYSLSNFFCNNVDDRSGFNNVFKVSRNCVLRQ